MTDSTTSNEAVPEAPVVAPRAASSIHPKVAGSAVAGAVTVIGLFIAQRFGLDMPDDVAASITVLVGLMIGYLIPSTD